jgi:hypothetical protein
LDEVLKGLSIVLEASIKASAMVVALVRSRDPLVGRWKKLSFSSKKIVCGVMSRFLSDITPARIE